MPRPEKRFCSSPPAWNELQDGESTYHHNGDRVVHSIKLDGEVYETEYGTPTPDTDIPGLDALGGIDITADGLNSGNSSWNGDSDVFIINDGTNDRVKLGKISSSQYGLQVLSGANTLVKLYGGTNEIAGWTIDTNVISKTIAAREVKLTVEGSEPRLQASSSGTNFVKVGMLSGTSIGILAVNNSVEVLRVDEGTAKIGGWEITDTLIRSSADGLDRVELNKAKNRVSIFDAANEKVVMGYLEGLQKNIIRGYATGGTSSTLVDSTATWDTDEHDGATVTITAGTGSGQEEEVGSNTDDTLTITGGTFSTPPDATSQYEISGRGAYDAADYGFWAKPGDHLFIDGDVQYENGDWIIQHDASYLINDADDNTILRLGTDTGKKGLFVYDTSGNKIAQFHNSGFTIGSMGGSDNYIGYSSGTLTVKGAISLEASEVTGALAYTPYNATNPGGFTDGMNSAEIAQVDLDENGMTFKDEDSIALARFHSTYIQLGVPAANTPNMLLDTDSLDFRVYNTTYATFGTTGIEIHPGGDEDFGTTITASTLKVRSPLESTGYRDVFKVSNYGVEITPFVEYYWGGKMKFNNEGMFLYNNEGENEQLVWKSTQYGSGDSLYGSQYCYTKGGRYSIVFRESDTAYTWGSIYGDSSPGEFSIRANALNTNPNELENFTGVNFVHQAHYDSGWIDVPGEDAGGSVAHGLSGVDPNAGKLIDYRVYLSNQDSPSQAGSDRWILWQGQTMDGNDHFTIAFDATNFNYHLDGDSSNSRVKWGVSGPTEETVLNACSFRIIAWTLF